MIPSTALWQQLYLNIAVSVTLAVAATAILSCWLTRPARRRTMWQACTLALLGIFLFELMGLNHELGGSVQRLIAGSNNFDHPVSLANQRGEDSITTESQHQITEEESADFASLPNTTAQGPVPLALRDLG